MQLTSLHTAEEMRQISNLAHILEGLVLGGAAVIVIAQAMGTFAEGRSRYVWPGLIVFAGAALLLYLLVPHHGLARARLQWSFVFGDPQQRQHVVIATLILSAGILELLARAGRLEGRVWSLAWPAALVAVGLLFIVHEQHGTGEAVARATRMHRSLGALLAVAGLLSGIDAMRARRTAGLTVTWALALLAAAVLLALYREPAGAYHSPMSDDERGSAAPRDSGTTIRR